MTVLSYISIIILYSTASLTYSDYCIIYIDSLSYPKHVPSPSCVIYFASRNRTVLSCINRPVAGHKIDDTSDHWYAQRSLTVKRSITDLSVAAHLQPLCVYSLYHTYSNYSIIRMHFTVYQCDAILYYLLSYYTYASLSPYRCSYYWN